jgi:hypothetical protein
VVIEITSKTTRREDQQKKWQLYRDVLQVPEYFQFDPTEDYLKPPLQGFKLLHGEYVPIEPVGERLPSEFLGLHLERDGHQLRLFDPVTGTRLLTGSERSTMAERRADAEHDRAEVERTRAEVERTRAEVERTRAESAESAQHGLAAENDRLRQEIEDLRRRSGASH